MSSPELPLSQVSFEARKKWRNFQCTWKSPIKVIHEKFEKQKALMKKSKTTTTIFWRDFVNYFKYFHYLDYWPS